MDLRDGGGSEDTKNEARFLQLEARSIPIDQFKPGMREGFVRGRGAFSSLPACCMTGDRGFVVGPETGAGGLSLDFESTSIEEGFREKWVSSSGVGSPHLSW